MGKKLPFPVKPMSVKFYEGDLEALTEFYGKRVGYNAIVRELTHRHVLALREEAARSGAINHDTIAELAGDLEPLVALDDGQA